MHVYVCVCIYIYTHMYIIHTHRHKPTYLFYKKIGYKNSNLILLSPDCFLLFLVHQINFRTNLPIFTKAFQNIDLNCVELIDQLTFLQY